MKLFPVITCEHASNLVPAQYANLFRGAEGVLASHRGYDLAAEGVAENLAKKLGAPIHVCRTTRLLIEPNRSIGHPNLFSEFTQSLSVEEKNVLLASVYHPYRDRVMETMSNSNKPILHLSIHSFTPKLDDIVRDVEIGLLFDPARRLESDCCAQMKELLQNSLVGYRIKFNEPYRGVDDGFTTFLRTKFSDETYAGIEIEINQKFEKTGEIERISDALMACVPKIGPLITKNR